MCTRLVGVCAFSGSFCGSKLVLSKRHCLVPPASTTEAILLLFSSILYKTSIAIPIIYTTASACIINKQNELRIKMMERDYIVLQWKPLY